MTWLYQWAQTLTQSGATREQLERDGFEAVGVDPRYGSILMRKRVDEKEQPAA